MDLGWSGVDHPAVLRLALAHDVTTYDASYLYLAQALGAALGTFDGKLSGAAGSGRA